MNQKILIPILIIAVVAVGVAVALTLSKGGKITNTISTDPLQIEAAVLDSLSNNISAQTSDEALIPEMESTLGDLVSNNASVSADKALDDTAITNEEQSLTNLETSISASQSDESTAGEATNTLRDTTQ